MFILILTEDSKFIGNSPKYSILNVSSKYKYSVKDYVHYLVSTYKITKELENVEYQPLFLTGCKMPEFTVTPLLYFDLRDTPYKLKLSKLGTDYIFNKICLFYKKECIGKYPPRYLGRKYI